MFFCQGVMAFFKKKQLYKGFICELYFAPLCIFSDYSWRMDKNQHFGSNKMGILNCDIIEV